MRSNSSSLSVAQADEDEDGQLTPLSHPNAQAETSGSFFSRVKQSLSSSPFSSILGQNNPNTLCSATSDSRNDSSRLDVNGELELYSSHGDSPALTPCRTSAVKHVLTPIPGHSPTHSRSDTISSTGSDASTDSEFLPSIFASSFPIPCFSPLSLSSQPTFATSVNDSDADDNWSSALTSPEIQDTPPLTPATSNNDATFSQSPKSTYSQPRSQRSPSISIRDDDMSEDSGSRKGKKPAPPFPYETLLADISGSSKSIPANADDICETDDDGEWWGLDYTLELSRRDSRASDTSSSTTGEHSKSRQSWAAMHHGVIPPLHEDANFQDWRRWHRALEKIEMRRRRKRTIDFIEESDHKASLFLDEMLGQRAVQLYEDRLTEEEIYDALVWIEHAAEHRPDPFFPPEKHNLGWVLKSHRSIACLREVEGQQFDED